MKLEHANVTVSDIDAATAFLKTAFPSAKIRGEGPRQRGGYWRHVGTDDAYIALQQEETPNESNRQAYFDIGFNHIGFEVSNIRELIDRITAAGYRSSDAGVDEEGRTSAYFYDQSGNEWEFVEYHSDINSIRNHYE